MSQKIISDFFKDPVGHGSTKRQNTTNVECVSIQVSLPALPSKDHPPLCSHYVAVQLDQLEKKCCCQTFWLIVLIYLFFVCVLLQFFEWAQEEDGLQVTTVCVLACVRLLRSSEEGVFFLNVKFVKTIKSVSLIQAMLLVHKTV